MESWPCKPPTVFHTVPLPQQYHQSSSLTIRVREALEAEAILGHLPPHLQYIDSLLLNTNPPPLITIFFMPIMFNSRIVKKPKM